MFCKECGGQLADDAKFCRHCGSPINAAPPAPAPVPPPPEILKAEPPPRIEPQVAPKAPAASANMAAKPASPAPKKGPSRHPPILIGVAGLVVVAVAIAGGAYFMSTKGETIAQQEGAALSKSEAPPSPSKIDETPASPPVAQTPPPQSTFLSGDMGAPTPSAAETTPAKSPDPVAAPAKTPPPVAKKKAPPPPPTAAVYPSPAAAPAYPPPAVTKSVDEMYKERHARECNSGITGLLCREQIRVSMCDGKWTSEPVSGKTICHVQKNDGQHGG